MHACYPVQFYLIDNSRSVCSLYTIAELYELAQGGFYCEANQHCMFAVLHILLPRALPNQPGQKS